MPHPLEVTSPAHVALPALVNYFVAVHPVNASLYGIPCEYDRNNQAEGEHSLTAFSQVHFGSFQGRWGYIGETVLGSQYPLFEH